MRNIPWSMHSHANLSGHWRHFVLVLSVLFIWLISTCTIHTRPVCCTMHHYVLFNCMLGPLMFPEFLSSDDRFSFKKWLHEFEFTISPEAEIFQGMFDTIINFTPSKLDVKLWSFFSKWSGVFTSWSKFTPAHTPVTAEDVLSNTLVAQW